jgi:hypothetical protein
MKDQRKQQQQGGGKQQQNPQQQNRQGDEQFGQPGTDQDRKDPMDRQDRDQRR